ncbi:MAG: ATP-binding protein [Ardenticatenaceae bacterium]
MAVTEMKNVCSNSTQRNNYSPALYVNGRIDNPYVYGAPVKDTFFGRQNELEQIMQAVTKPRKQDILLVGERRSGKTSLLYQLESRISKPFIPVYVVLNTSKPTTNEVLKLIIRKIVQQLVRQELIEPHWMKERFAEIDFIEDVKKIIDAAKENLADVKLVLLLDEADYLLKVEVEDSGLFLGWLNSIRGRRQRDERVQNLLRAALQSREIGADLRAVVAGTSDLSTYISQRSSPFFNHFRLVRLKPLTVPETRQLITKPVAGLAYCYSQDAIERIITLSGGHPYYCQALCYEAFNEALQNERHLISTQDVAAAKRKVVADFFNSYLSAVWQRSNQIEKRYLRALAQGKPTDNSSRAQIRRLLDWQIVTENERNYSFSSDLLKEWTLIAMGEVG